MDLHALLRCCKGVDDRRPGPPRPRLLLLLGRLLLLLLLGLLHRRADPERHLRMRGVRRRRRRLLLPQPARPQRRRCGALRLLQSKQSQTWVLGELHAEPGAQALW